MILRDPRVLQLKCKSKGGASEERSTVYISGQIVEKYGLFVRWILSLIA
jgi:hypothetical protein